uniref:DNA-directed RNA polymerase subunit beta' n=1 Tax=Lathyrus palustris TaxID=313104 RepID=A0A0F6NFA2_LATPA|nr:RNA polymerase beta [Lathyrus palustris]AIK21159.1 RNA polymerase beta [Lathyrus palustris]
MINQYKHQHLRIGSVSPEQISAWAKKILPNGETVGEVTKPYTLHYKTNKPEKDGLFCERIFGPIKSGICACGNYRVIGDKKDQPKFCEQCGVEFVDSRIRRYQMGYIKLACPVTHVWYLKRLPSYIASILDKPLKELEDLVYRDVYPNFSFARPVVKKPTFLRLRGSFEYEIQSWKDSIPLFFATQGFDTFRNREISSGAGAIREQLVDLDLRIIMDSSFLEWKELGEEGSTDKEEGSTDKEEGSTDKEEGSTDKWEDRKVGRRKNFLVRRMELAKHFLRTNIEPEWMVLCLLPVLPPELRPIIQIDGGKLMSSDINELYRRIIYRNNTLIDLLTTSRFTPGELVMSQEKLVQEAVDTLLDNGIRGQPMRDGHNKVYKSFSDIIEGKEGRFRETLLGKRVDYSGRSVIVVGPLLSLHRCGLPPEIAIELFQTFLIRGLIRNHFASNIGVAKSQIREKEPIVWEILQEVMRGHPVLLNRAPTLHRLGIQAFQPILVEGRAICLHPLVCKGFNADFDGDQMAVHVPLSLEAQAEARLLMFSNTNLLSPAIGDPICVPTQDMLIGLYVLTSGNRRGICSNRYNWFNCRNSQNEKMSNNNFKNLKYMKKKEPFFCNSYDAIGAYRQKRINFDSPFWLRWRIDQCIMSSREVPIEVHYESFGTYYEIYGDYLVITSIKKEIRCIYIRTTIGHISFYREIEEAIQGFSRADSYGI